MAPYGITLEKLIDILDNKNIIVGVSWNFQCECSKNRSFRNDKQ